MGDNVIGVTFKGNFLSWPLDAAEAQQRLPRSTSRDHVSGALRHGIGYLAVASVVNDLEKEKNGSGGHLFGQQFEDLQ